MDRSLPAIDIERSLLSFAQRSIHRRESAIPSRLSTQNRFVDRHRITDRDRRVVYSER